MFKKEFIESLVNCSKNSFAKVGIKINTSPETVLVQDAVISETIDNQEMERFEYTIEADFDVSDYLNYYIIEYILYDGDNIRQFEKEIYKKIEVEGIITIRLIVGSSYAGGSY
jgi:hypothetical protein